MEELKLVKYILEKKMEVIVPLSLLKSSRILEELEKALSTVSPAMSLSRFFGKLADNLDEVLVLDKLSELLSFVQEYEEEAKKKYGISLSDDDLKIIDFLSSIEGYRPEYFIDAAGPLYFIAKTLKELVEGKGLPINLTAYIIMKLYADTYELTLYEIDRKIYTAIMYPETVKNDRYREIINALRKKKPKLIRNFLDDEKIPRKKTTEHATAGGLNDILVHMKILQKDNHSILGGKGSNKIYRNNISHMNMFYDEETNTVYLGRGKIKLEELEKALAKLLLFHTEWLRRTLNTENIEEAINTIKNTLKQEYRALAKGFHKIKRYHREIHLARIILRWKKEAEEH